MEENSSNHARQLTPPPLARCVVMHDLLVDGAEYRLPAGVEHLYPDAIAEFEVRRRRLALLHGFDRADLGDAGMTGLVAVVGDRSRAEDGPRAEATRFCGVCDQVRKVELHVDAAVGRADPLVVDVHGEGEVEPLSVPG